MKKLLVILALIGFTLPTYGDDIINVDTSQITNPQLAAAIEAAEQFWDDRIIGYSNELDSNIRAQLSTIDIVAMQAADDGVGGRLAFAQTTSFVSFDATTTLSFYRPEGRSSALPTTGMLVFDEDDLPDLIANGSLEFVALHELTHALGFSGFIFSLNGLTTPINGQTQYTEGIYALPTYRLEANDPTLQFIPLEQTGGAGTAGSHWDDVPPVFNQVDTPAFRAAVMRGFLFIFDADGNTVLPNSFLPDTTLGVMADIGYAVVGVNEELMTEVGEGADPFDKRFSRTINADNTGDNTADGIGFGLGNNAALAQTGNVVRVKSSFITGISSGLPQKKAAATTAQQRKLDPFNLKGRRWAK